MAIIPPDNDQSKLLFDSYPLVIIPELAEAIGLNEAIVLQQIHYWIIMNKEAGRNFEEGRYWTYNSINQWEKQFPFWSKSTIRRTITSLEGQGLIVTANYNKLKIDRTKWYSIDYEKLNEVLGEAKNPETPPRCQNEQMELVKMNKPLPETSEPETNKKNKVKGSSPKNRERTSPASFEKFKNRIQEQISPFEKITLDLMELFVREYENQLNKPHPKLKPTTWAEIIKTLLVVEDEFGDDIGPEIDQYFPLMIRKHFATEYQQGCDYALPHFNQNQVKLFRWYDVQREGPEAETELAWDYDKYREA